MLDFEGNMSEHSLRSKHQVLFEDEDDDATDLAFSMTSVSASDLEAKWMLPCLQHFLCYYLLRSIQALVTMSHFSKL